VVISVTLVVLVVHSQFSPQMVVPQQVAQVALAAIFHLPLVMVVVVQPPVDVVETSPLPPVPLVLAVRQYKVKLS
jgi:hypothetical protein